MSAANEPPDLFTVFRAIRAWTDHAYRDHLGVELVVRLPGRKPVRLAVPAYGRRDPAVLPMAADAAAQTQAAAAGWRHSPDYREISWCGYRFQLSKAQGAVVELLDLARRQDTPAVDQSVILRQIGSEATRLSDLFRRGDGARAWGLLVVQDPELPGSYRLAERPPEPPPDTAA